MKSLDQFVSDWTGRGADWDKSYGNQCMDLYRFYVNEVVGGSQSAPVVGAKDVWETYNKDTFTRVANTPDGIPPVGAVMIWGDKYGKFGHIAIVTRATISTFTCFSQNDPTGALCGLKTYRTYAPTLGWLIPKGVTTSDPNIETLKADLEAKTKTLADVTRQRDELDADNKKKDSRISEITAQLSTANENAEGFRKELKDFVATLAGIFGTRQEKVEIIAEANKAITFEDKSNELDRTLELERKEHAYAITELEKQLSTLKSTTEATIIKLEGQIKELKYSSVTPTQPVTKYSIIDIIKSILGVK